MEKKYNVQYTSGATGYGWSDDFDRLDEFEYFVNDIRKEYTAKLTVYDRTIKKFIFWKDCLTFTPYIDMLRSGVRDMRTKTRMYK